MDLHLIIAIVAGFLVIAGLLFLSMIHLFMIPRDIMKRDTSHQASLEGRESFSNNESGSSRLPDKPEIRENPQQKPEPEIEDYPRPEPEVEREPGQQDEPEREKEPERRRA